MREAFARWACNPVTQPPGEGLQLNINEISDVTLVTHVTLKKQQAQLCVGRRPAPAVEADLNKNRVTRVTRVTYQESLEKTCNPNIGDRVTGLQKLPEGLTHDQWSEAESWPVPTGRVFLAVLRYLVGQGIAYEAATVGAYQATKALMERFGGPVSLVADPPWVELPPEARPEVDATMARLAAGGWKPDRAKLLAKALVARRLGLSVPDTLAPLDPEDAPAAVMALH